MRWLRQVALWVGCTGSNQMKSFGYIQRVSTCGAALALALFGAGCTGTVGEGGGNQGEVSGAEQPGRSRPGGSTSGAGAPGATGGAPGATGSSAGGTTTPGGGLGPERPTGNDTALSCSPAERGVGPRRIWRLDATQYANTVAAVLGGAAGKPGDAALNGLAVPFQTKGPGDRFSTRAASYEVTELDMSAVIDGAGEISTRMITQLETTGCLGKMPFAECAGRTIAEKGALLFRRPLTPQELSAYRDAATKNAAALGEKESLRSVLGGMLSSPYFLFRTELGEGPSGGAGMVKLTPYEVASALSYSLTDWPPDAELMQAAQAGALTTPEQVRAQALRLLGQASDRAKVQRFFTEWLGFEELETVFKEPKQFPFYDGPALLQDVQALVRDLLASNGRDGFVRALFSTRQAVVRGKTLEAFNLPKDATLGTTQTRKVTLPEGQRAGILTHPAFLAAHGKADDRHPVEFGHYIREHILCQNVPAIPEGLNVVLSDDPTLTWKERLTVTRDAKCWGCHTMMDPLGLAYQVFDHAGRHRMVENGKPVDAADRLDGAGKIVEGPFKDGVELSERLSRSPTVEECFVRQSFRFWMGREETAVDSCTLAEAHTAYASGKGSYVDLVVALFSSPTFLNRTAQ